MLISRVALIPKLEALVNITKRLTAEAIQAAVRNSLCMAKQLTPRKAVWRFARYVVAMSRTAYLSRTNAKRIFRVWHREASWMRDMPSFRECWLDFWQALPKVTCPVGLCLENLSRKAYGEGRERLESLVHVLSRYHGGKPFAMSCEALSTVFGVSPRTVSRWLERLVNLKVLVVTQQHNWRGASAREYQLKSLENKSFGEGVQHAVNGVRAGVAKRSGGGDTNPEKGYPGKGLYSSNVLQAFLSHSEREKFLFLWEVFTTDEGNRGVARRQIGELFALVETRKNEMMGLI